MTSAGASCAHVSTEFLSPQGIGLPFSTGLLSVPPNADVLTVKECPCQVTQALGFTMIVHLYASMRDLSY